MYKIKLSAVSLVKRKRKGSVLSKIGNGLCWEQCSILQVGNAILIKINQRERKTAPKGSESLFPFFLTNTANAYRQVRD